MDIRLITIGKAFVAMNKVMTTPDETLDITSDICPMTYVRVRLTLDRMVSGQTLLVLLSGDDPRRNVPASARSQGHFVVAEENDEAGLTRLLIRKG